MSKMNSLVSLVVLSLALCVVAGSKLKCTPYGLALGCHPVGLARYTLIWIPYRAKYNRLSIHKSFLTQTLKLQRSSMPAASIKSCKFIVHTLKNVTLIKFFCKSYEEKGRRNRNKSVSMYLMGRSFHRFLVKIFVWTFFFQNHRWRFDFLLILRKYRYSKRHPGASISRGTFLLEKTASV